jgi:hypothetical protein
MKNNRFKFNPTPVLLAIAGFTVNTTTVELKPEIETK